MPRRKVLKSVVHNIGHSFISLMNYADDDYAMGHILRFARQSAVETLTIDFVTASGAPPVLLQPPLSNLPERYSRFFWDLVDRHGSHRCYVREANLTLHFDIGMRRELRGRPQFVESPFTCDVRLTDDRGKHYTSHFSGWWYPERLEPPPSNWSWWRFWNRFDS